MKNTSNGIEHVYGNYINGDVLVDYIVPAEIFKSREDMYKYLQSKMTDDCAMMQLDPPALTGKYLEVLSMKAISLDTVKLVCHSYKQNPAFCHNVTNTNHKTMLMYSMVKQVDDGNLFPVVFFNHQGCTNEYCVWVTHVNEVLIIDKKIG